VRFRRQRNDGIINDDVGGARSRDESVDAGMMKKRVIVFMVDVMGVLSESGDAVQRQFMPTNRRVLPNLL